MHAGLERARRLAGIPALDQLPALRLGEPGQFAHGRARRLFERRRQAADGALEIGAYARRVELRDQLGGQPEALAEIVDAQRARVVGALLAVEHLDALPARDAAAVDHGAFRAVAEVEQGAEQRRRSGHPAAALREGQRGMLVAHQVGQRAMRAQRSVAHADAAHLHPQRQGVDEQPHHVLDALAALPAAQQDGTEHHVLAARQLADHVPPGEVEQARHAHAEPARLLAQPRCQLRRQLAHGVDDLHALAPVVGVEVAEAVRQGRLVDVGQHRAEEGFAARAAPAQPRTGDVVAERRRRRQRVPASVEMGRHLAQQDRDIGMVERDVVGQQQQHPAVGRRVVGIADRHRRRLAQVDAEMPGIEAILQLQADLAERRVEPRHLFGRQPRLATHHLHRLAQAFPGDPRAQHVVPRHHRLQGGHEALQRGAAAEAESHPRQVSVALALREMVVEHPFLQRRERVDILHVRCAARHRRDDDVDLGLVQLDQAQHRRFEMARIGGNPVGRHRVVGGRMQRGGQVGQRGRAEQRLDIGLEAGLAQFRDQAYGQQRMAAELEEVVVPAHLLDPEQRRPDFGQQALCLALRRRIVASRVGPRLGGGQRATVELAVGRERQRIERDIGSRHHVARQTVRGMLAQRLGAGRLRLAVSRGVVGHQAPVARRVLAHDHGHLAHPHDFGQPGLDLAELDPEAANLDLVVVAA
ncbi:Uncharacterised protein [Burkholderia gladioli]|nr:Uncharacterised protein [Burkholderia gladioli]